MAGFVSIVIYDIDRARYLTPVPVGSRTRDRIVLVDFHEHQEKPAAVLDRLTLAFRDLPYRARPRLSLR